MEVLETSLYNLKLEEAPRQIQRESKTQSANSYRHMKVIHLSILIEYDLRFGPLLVPAVRISRNYKEGKCCRGRLGADHYGPRLTP